VPIEQVGSSITVVTAKEIEQQQKRTVADALRMVPGLDLVTSGGPGQTSSVFMRGANSNHTLILIDGVEMSDPSSTGGGYDLANLTTDNIKQIEVLRGPQSTLYGSKAIGGVISITTKQGEGKPTGFVSAEGGSFYTARETAAISGGTNLIHYTLTASRIDTDGISSAAARYGNVLNNGYQNSSIATRFGITPNKNSEIEMSLRYTRAKASIDNGGGAGQDDPNNFLKTDELQFRTQGTLSLFKDLWEQKLGVSFHDLTRTNDNDRDASHPYDFLRSEYHGQSVKVDWQNTLRLHETNTVVLGVETTEENAKSRYYSEYFDTFFSTVASSSSIWDEKFARTNGSYLQDQISLWDTWFSTLGVRVDDHSQFGTEATYRFTTAYLLRQTNTKLKGSYGTGFKAPSLFQLYAAGGFVQGNSSLLPEKSTGWDIGIEQFLAGNQLNVGATYFHNDFEQLIEGYTVPVTFVYTYRNIAKAESEGVELTASYQPLAELAFHATYTYTLAKDKSTGAELIRRPKHKISGDVNYHFLDKGNINLGFVYVGTRNDLAFDPVTYTSQTVKLKDYLLVNLAGSYDITKNLQLFGRVDNLFDRQYEEVAGYGTPGIGAYGGVKVSF
jgi:vitamin B12 transporter